MSTTEEQYAKDIMEDKLGFSDEQSNAAIYAAELLAAGSGWGAAAVVAYEILDAWFSSSSSSHPVDEVLQQLVLMAAKSTAASWGEYIDAAKKAANAINVAGTRASEYADTPGLETRDRLSGALSDIDTTLRDVLDGRSIPFMPTVYLDEQGKEMPWVKGRAALFSIFNIDRYNASTHQFDGDVYKFQTYRDVGSPSAGAWALPPELNEASTSPRWDGLLSRKVAVFGIPTWLTVLSLLEPFYQLSGVWRKDLAGMRDKAYEFMTNWRNETLSTRDMPTFIQALINLSPQGWVGGTVWWKGLPLPLGFTSWPCGVLDPVMGVEICSAHWWQAEKPELMTEAQRKQFSELRFGALQRLLEANGFNTFAKLSETIEVRLVIPAKSPSLAVHPDLLRSPTLIALEPAPQVEHVSVTDPGGTVWQGTAHQRSAQLEAPVSVQPNPAPPPVSGVPTARRAVTDTVFGYRITVTPKGGSEQSTPSWHWHLRLDPGSSSLYHEIVEDSSGTHERIRQPMPYEVAHTVSTTATTFVTVTDGTLRDETDAKPNQPVTFTMTVRVCDMPVKEGKDWIPFPARPNAQQQREQDIWIQQHGVIWIKISADAASNHNRSFDLQVNVTEISAISTLTGERLKWEDFSDAPNPQQALENAAHSSTVHMSIPVDIATIVVPSAYFDWILRALTDILHSYTDRTVRPKPDPPEVELSQLRLILAEDSVRRQSFVNEFQRITKRPSLTTEQALAEVDRALAHLVSSAAAAPTFLDTASTAFAVVVDEPTAAATAGTTSHGAAVMVADRAGAGNRGLHLGAPLALAGRVLKRLTGSR